MLKPIHDVVDDAAIRSGRVDFRMELTHCDAHQIEQMFRKFHDDAGAAKRFATEQPAGKWSPAQVQERLLKAHSVEEAFAQFKA